MYTIVNMVGYGEIWNVKSASIPRFSVSSVVQKRSRRKRPDKHYRHLSRHAGLPIDGVGASDQSIDEVERNLLIHVLSVDQFVQPFGPIIESLRAVRHKPSAIS
jgi:hypothetical protein